MSSPLRLLACLYLAALGCTEAADIPDVPNLRALDAQYDDPTAAFDGDEVRALLASYPELERLARALRASEPFVDNVDEARDAANQQSGSGIDLRGGLTITAACPGQDAEPRFDSASTGTFSLDLAVQDGAIKPSFWATANHCLMRGVLGSATFPVELDGQIAMDIGSPIGLETPWQRGRTLLSMQGSISIDTLTLSGLSARYGLGDFEYLQEVPGGSVVLFVRDDGIGARDRDTTWWCDRETATCGVR